MGVQQGLLLLCLMTLVCSGWAARRVDANARARDTMRRRREESGVMKRHQAETLETKELLQLTEGESMSEVRRNKDAHGSVVERLQERYNGISVYDSSVTVRKDEKGHLTGDASGTLIQDIADDLPDTTRKLTDEQTLNIVIAAEGDGEKRNYIRKISYEILVVLDANDKARLINKVSYLIDGLKRPMYFIDLQNGDILRHFDSLMTMSCCHKSQAKTQLIGGNAKYGKIMYGSQPYCLNFTVDKCGVCYLENQYVRVVDLNYTEPYTGNTTKAASFPCDTVYGDAINGAYSPAIDAFFYGTIVGKMFEEWYGTTVLRNKTIIRVHYGVSRGMAYYDGESTTFGDGDDKMFPLTTLDVIGHEFGHGVVQEGSNLEYHGESGGINEGFADIMAQTAEFFLSKTDYLVGHYVMKELPYKREFEKPENDNKSIGHVDNMDPDMNVHYSSGIYRRVWYIVVKDQGMDIKEVFTVFRFANQMYWHPLSTFYDASCGTLKAAMDLGMDTKPFAVAFESVGIPKCDVSSHVFTAINNKTIQGISVSDVIQLVFAFDLPVWGKVLLVEAISLSGGRIHISLLQGTWQEKENDAATVVQDGFTKIEFHPSRKQPLWNTTESQDDNNSTKPSTIKLESELEKFFIKLDIQESFTTYRDIELTVGYVCEELEENDDIGYYINCLQ